MNYKYGNLSKEQIVETRIYIRKQIYFLLLIVDPKTKEEYENINVNDAFNGLMIKLSGLNELLQYPTELVRVMSLLEAALIEYNKEDFSYSVYRKLILDAGSEVLKIYKEVK